MHTLWFGVIFFVHLSACVAALGAVIVIDTAGLLWLLRRPSFTLGSVMRVAAVTQPLIWIGFAVLIVSGVVMQLQFKGIDQASWVKFGAVGALGVNGLVLYRIKRRCEALPETATPADARRYMPGMVVATTVSQVGWWSAVLIGFLHALLRKPLSLPIAPVWVLGVCGVVWLGAALTAGILERKLTVRS